MVAAFLSNLNPTTSITPESQQLTMIYRSGQGKIRKYCNMKISI